MQCMQHYCSSEATKNPTEQSTTSKHLSHNQLDCP